MARYDAGRTSNQSGRSTRIFKDLDLDFQQNTATKDIQKMLDVESVKRSVKNLINLNHYEKPFHPEIGSNLRGKQIELLIKNYAPRCRLVQVKNMPDLDRNGYMVSISFYVQNVPTPVIVESFLERLR